MLDLRSVGRALRWLALWVVAGSLAAGIWILAHRVITPAPQVAHGKGYLWIISASALERLQSAPGGSSLAQAFFSTPKSVIVAGGKAASSVLGKPSLYAFNFASYAVMLSRLQ